ncbi:hypothetical protein E2562_017357 [Oryza meyeriana var. granulata]|uniref:Uncharacterized protein n=1 Tax=Oryza meyeriana var. granulata TaxID=110450 RepID=A0A6G1D4S7_9ORYZ|nr:hypothetical protein E2562_017357 [Oryza meyeriana var. granulata]
MTVCSWGGLGKLMAFMRQRSTFSGVDLAVGPSTVPAKGVAGVGSVPSDERPDPAGVATR